MNIFKRPRKVEFPDSGSGWVEVPKRMTIEKFRDQMDQRAADYLNSYPANDEELAELREVKTGSRSWDPLFPPETLALFERVRAHNIREHGTPRAKVVKRAGYWISIVYGSDGVPVLYDEVPATLTHAYKGWRGGWALIMESARDDLATVRRIECAGHRLPEAPNTTHY